MAATWRAWRPSAVALVVFAATTPSWASLTASETEQVRRAVSTATDLGRLRALVARPDLSADEAAQAVIAPLITTAIDPTHVSFFRDLLFGEASASSRPVLVSVVLRGLLARADAVIAQHGTDLGRSPTALAELRRAYGFAEEIASATVEMNVPPSSDSACAAALKEHLARNAAVLLPEAAVGPAVVPVRAQAAIALLDFMPDAGTRRIDAADALRLTGARRALLVERKVLVLDGGGSDARFAAFRALLDRLPALNDGLEAVVIGGDGAGLAARDGAVVAVTDDPGGAAAARLLWGSDVRSPPGDGWSTTVARGLALAAVSRAAQRRPDLRARMDRHGGVAGVAAMAAMLLLDGPLGVEVAAARLLDGRGESATCLGDAIGALAVFADPPASKSADGLAVPVGPAKAAGIPTTRLTHVLLDAAGAATAFRLEGHTWAFERGGADDVTGFRRDGIPVTVAMLVAVRA